MDFSGRKATLCQPYRSVKLASGPVAGQLAASSHFRPPPDHAKGIPGRSQYFHEPAVKLLSSNGLR